MANIPSFNVVIEEIDNLVEDVIQKMTKTSGSDCGLDERCGRLWISKDCIAIRSTSQKTFEYYGGLEYVDREEVVSLGDYVIYSADAQRISSMIGYYENKHGELEEEIEDTVEDEVEA
jgi:hypothetical protein